MPATQEITESLIRDNIVRAVDDVFRTMLDSEAVLRPADDSCPATWPTAPAEASPASETHVVGTVGFLGDANGLLYLYLDESFAKHCTCAMLGMSEREIAGIGEAAVNDAVGELTNMIVGSFKNGLCSAGYSCKLTIPSILRGRNFCIEPISSAERNVYSFDCAGRRLVADILMKTDN
jgi:chemotaxis protein CheX